MTKIFLNTYSEVQNLDLENDTVIDKDKSEIVKLVKLNQTAANGCFYNQNIFNLHRMYCNVMAAKSKKTLPKIQNILNTVFPEEATAVFKRRVKSSGH